MKKCLSLITLAFVIFLSSFVSGRVGGGDILFRAEKARDVIFSHESHVSEIGLKCTNCHDRLYTTPEKHKKVTMLEMRKGVSCGACHNGKMAFDVRGNCSDCHKKN